MDYTQAKLIGTDSSGKVIGTKISNVAKGDVKVDSLDAVNGSQLWAASNSFATFLGGGANINAFGVLTGPQYDIASIGKDGKAGANNTFTDVGAALGGLNSNITNVNDRVTNLNTRFEASQLDALRWDEGKKSFTAVHGAGNSGTGGTTKIAPVEAVASGANKITDLQAGAVNATSTDAVNGSQLHETNQNLAALDKNAVKYKLSPDGTKTNTVKLEGGDPNAPVLVKNVAEAKEGTDAVNKNQLDVVDKKIVDQTNTINERVATIETRTTNTLTEANGYTDQKFDDAKRYTDRQFNKLSSDIGSVRKEAHQAAAIGLAAASLRFDSAPGKISVATGGGVWQGQAAMAFGAGYTSESGMVRANLTGAVSGEGVGVGAGVSFTLN